jgi:MFS family permease
LAAIPGFIGVLLLIALVKEKPKEPLPISASLSKINNFNFSFKFFTLISCIFAIGNSFIAFLILRAQNLGLSTIQIILVYVTFNVTYALFSTPAGIISDSIGKKKVVLLGFFLFSLVYLLFGFVQQKAFLWLLFPIYGVFMALTDGVGKAYISELVPQKNLGAAYGIYQTTTGICTFFASLIAGLLWYHINVQVPFLFGGIVGLVAGIMFLLM